MKILFVTANPISTGRLAIDEELRKIDIAIQLSKYRDKVSLKAIHATRPRELIRELNRERPDIVHMSAHGDRSGAIILVGEDGEPRAVAPEILRDIFASLETPPRLVVLNACYSFEQAQGIVETVDALIGVPGPISDTYAIEFSSALYESLAAGVSVSYSYKQALIGAGFNRPEYWKDGEPILLNREGRNTEFALSDTPPPKHHAERILPRRDRIFFTDRELGRTFLKTEFAEFAEGQGRLSLLFFDIDRMNSINVSFGRPIGDRVLVETTLLIDRNSPQALAAGICGDDTFFCALESDDSRYIRDFGRNLMTIIESHDWGRIRPGLYVRVTGGYAVRAKDQQPIQLVVEAGLALRRSQTEAKDLLNGSGIDVDRRLRGRYSARDRELPEDIMRELFS